MFQMIDTWKLLAGLGMFLFAMFLMEEALKILAGRSFRRVIREGTNNLFNSIFTGAVSTAILQSSSAVSLMVLSFVGAGIMAMDSAIGVILGSNIGTTATAWIVATFGFKMNIEAFALPLIGIGGLILIIPGSSEKLSNFSKLIVGFGFLFMGLSYMKSGVEDIGIQFSFEKIPDYGIPFFFLFGIVFTLIIQSSSATIAIVLTGLNADLISFENGAAIVIGANIGTTGTILIGAIKGTVIKKRVAYSHLIFNTITCLAGIFLLWPLIWLIEFFLGAVENNTVIGLALFDSTFNILSVIFFIPFIPLLSRILVRIVPERNTLLTHHIHNLSTDVPDAAISGIRMEIRHLVKRTMKHNLSVFTIPHLVIFNKKNKPDDREKIKLISNYENLKLLQSSVFTFASDIQQQTMSKENTIELNRLLHASRTSISAAKMIKDINHNLQDFEKEDNDFIQSSITNFRNRIIASYLTLTKILDLENDTEIAGQLSEFRKMIDKEDTEFITVVMQAAAKDEIKNLQVSDILTVNRAIVHSNRHLYEAVMEILLTEEESGIVERISG